MTQVIIGPREEPITIVLLNEHTVDHFLNVYVYTHVVLPSTLVREASLCRGQQLTGQSAEKAYL